jgi:hypothetical protein
MNDPVDVLIIGAGASGAAVAWSLAETKSGETPSTFASWLHGLRFGDEPLSGLI